MVLVLGLLVVVVVVVVVVAGGRDFRECIHHYYESIGLTLNTSMRMTNPWFLTCNRVCRIVERGRERETDRDRQRVEMQIENIQCVLRIEGNEK
jgi:hypothetical protein